MFKISRKTGIWELEIGLAGEGEKKGKPRRTKIGLIVFWNIELNLILIIYTIARGKVTISS